jgi:hypothetical protein
VELLGIELLCIVENILWVMVVNAAHQYWKGSS